MSTIHRLYQHWQKGLLLLCFLSLIIAVTYSFLFQSCADLQSSKQVDVYPFESYSSIPELIMGQGQMSKEQLTAFFIECNPDADEDRISHLATLYIDECATEGVNSDIAFVQMCLETGFLRFGGLVTEDMNNFCGLGATDPEHPGHRFADMLTGVRAHVQHLKAYGSTEPLVGELIDPRFHLVEPRGRAPGIHDLAGTWAADYSYALKLEELLEILFSK